MKKILFGLLAALVIAIGGFFGYQYYVQQRVAQAIEATFEQIRSAGGKASHGKVAFDLLTRTVSIADIESQSASQPSLHVKVANVTLIGVDQPDATHLAASTMKIAGAEIDAAMTTPLEGHLSYKMPEMTVKDYFGPAATPNPPPSSNALDLYRFVLAQFAGIRASSVSLPSLTGTLEFNVAASAAATKTTADFSYSNLNIEGIKDGKIAVMKVDSVGYAMNSLQAGKPSKLAGHIENIVSHDIDIGAMAAILDPQAASDDSYHTVYRQTSAGPYTITTPLNQNLRIEAVAIDDVALRPSRIQLPALLALIQKGQPTPEQVRDAIEKIGLLYEGIRLGKYEFRGVTADTPQGPLKVSALRFSLDNGKSDLALEGLDATTPMGPLKLERFALNSLDLAALMRFTALFANPAQRPPPAQTVQLLQALGGAEVKGVVVPYKDGKKTVSIDAINLNWGQFVGPLPTKAHLDAKFATPVDASNPTTLPLLAAGIDTLKLDANLSAGWDEASGGFLLDAPTFEVGSLLKASARVALAKVPRGVFTLDPQQASLMAEQIEAGTLELTLHDLGMVDALVAQYARTKNLSREAARAAIADEIKAGGEKFANANPATPDLVAALIHFVQTSGQTLLVKLTPVGTVPVQALLRAAQADPQGAVGQFRIEVSTGL
jgi:hypothetical protein